VKFCNDIKKRNSLYIEKKCENCVLYFRCTTGLDPYVDAEIRAYS